MLERTNKEIQTTYIDPILASLNELNKNTSEKIFKELAEAKLLQKADGSYYHTNDFKLFLQDYAPNISAVKKFGNAIPALIEKNYERKPLNHLGLQTPEDYMSMNKTQENGIGYYHDMINAIKTISKNYAIDDKYKTFLRRLEQLTQIEILINSLTESNDKKQAMDNFSRKIKNPEVQAELKTEGSSFISFLKTTKKERAIKVITKIVKQYDIEYPAEKVNLPNIEKNKQVAPVTLKDMHELMLNEFEKLTTTQIERLKAKIAKDLKLDSENIKYAKEFKTPYKEGVYNTDYVVYQASASTTERQDIDRRMNQLNALEGILILVNKYQEKGSSNLLSDSERITLLTNIKNEFINKTPIIAKEGENIKIFSSHKNEFINRMNEIFSEYENLVSAPKKNNP